GSLERLGEHPPFPLPGGHLLSDRTVSNGGSPSLPRVFSCPCAAQSCLPVGLACTHPLFGVHHRTDTLCFHGCTDPDVSGSLRL
ncbi:hypothetical protein XENOCAPTIV_022884, partial [Xenoophorus captivus]